MLKLDCTTVLVVVTCTDCDFWSAAAFGKTEGWITAAAHEERAHPEQQQARHALVQHRAWLARQARENSCQPPVRRRRVTLHTPADTP